MRTHTSGVLVTSEEHADAKLMGFDSAQCASDDDVTQLIVDEYVSDAGFSRLFTITDQDGRSVSLSDMEAVYIASEIVRYQEAQERFALQRRVAG